MAFCHLHVHTEYSLLDGAARIGPLVARAKALGMRHLAVTDHGSMYGVVDFYEACLKEGIHPVIGCEVYVAPGSLTSRAPDEREAGHLVLLCENETGYRNLSWLSSEGYLHGFYYRPRVDLAALRAHSEGLIALSACLSGDVPRLLLAGQYGQAKQMAVTYREIFGEENYFFELQNHGLREQDAVNDGLVRLSRELGIPLAATNDVHYVEKKDAFAQEVLLCIQTGKTLDDPARMRMGSEEFYLKSEDEMRARFGHLPEALENTVKIAERCQYDFAFGKYHIPAFPVPKGLTPAAYLRRLAEAGFAELYPHPTDEAAQRLRYELDTIERMGYVEYFLIVWDYVRFAHDSGIMVGPGRGSGAGSIVAYSLRITAIDPLQFGLIFERFLNPERVSMPDFDIDFCYERRQEVIDYVVQKYGADHVAQIITFGTMAARGVLRDVGRVLGMTYAQVDQIAKAVPMQLGMTLQKALEISPDLRRMQQEDEQIARMLELGMALEGMPRHASTHAAGVVVTNRPVVEYVPLQRNDEVITTQFTMTVVEKLGLLKMDFLGLRTLTILRDTMAMLRQGRGISLRLEDIPLDDRATYEMLSQADTEGVFQLESDGMRRVLIDLQPSCMEEIIAIISLYRPGPMESIPKYIAGKKHPEDVAYLHPLLERSLKETYGCMVYQEQVMQMVRDIAGYTMGRSDIVRRIISKKKASEMEKERQIFLYGLDEGGRVVVPGAVRNGVPEGIARELFGQMEAFASYSFNKSHAAAYAFVAYWTAFMKRHYPVEFLAACMNSAMPNTDKIASFIQHCRGRKIGVLPPHVNHSQAGFTVQDGKIRFGLAAVKNVGQGAVQDIVAEREKDLFRDFFDFCERVSSDTLNKRSVESLIKAGAFDGMGASRAQLSKVYEGALDSIASERKNNVRGQVSLFELAPEPVVGGRMPLPDVPEFDLRYRLQMEKEMTGIYISGHPLDDYTAALSALTFNTARIHALMEEGDPVQFDGERVVIGGILAQVRTRLTKTNAQMANVRIEDLYGSVEGLAFPRVCEQFGPLLQVDSVLRIAGRLSIREDEEPKLIVEDVRPLEKESGDPGRLYLKVRSQEEAEGLYFTVRRFRGGTPVFVHTTENRQTYRAPTRWDCEPSAELLEALRSAIGEENVRLVRQREGAAAR